MDGARLLNACTALGVSAAAVAEARGQHVDRLHQGARRPHRRGPRRVRPSSSHAHAATSSSSAAPCGRRASPPRGASTPSTTTSTAWPRITRTRSRLARGLAEGGGHRGAHRHARTPTWCSSTPSGLGLSNREFLDRLAASGVRMSGGGRGDPRRHPPRRLPRGHRPRPRRRSHGRLPPRVNRHRSVSPHHLACPPRPPPGSGRRAAHRTPAMRSSCSRRNTQRTAGCLRYPPSA